MRSIRIIAACLVAMVTGGLGAATQANAAQPGDVCQVISQATIFVTSRDHYFVFHPSYVRIVGYAGPSDYWGHGNGRPDGSFSRSSINQATCYQ